MNNAFGSAVATTMAFITLSFAELLFVFVARSDSKPIFKIGLFSNKQLVIGVLCIILIQLLVIFNPTLSGLLELESLTPQLYAIAIINAIIFMVFAEILKVLVANAFEVRRKILKERKKQRAMQNANK